MSAEVDDHAECAGESVGGASVRSVGGAGGGCGRGGQFVCGVLEGGVQAIGGGIEDESLSSVWRVTCLTYSESFQR